MVREFGGKYSPTGKLTEEAVDNRKVDAAGARSNLLFIPPVVLALFSLGSPAAMALGLAGAGALIGAAFLLREGLRAEAAYNARKVARRPAFPRKMFATVLTGAGVTLAALSGATGLLGAVTYGVIASVLHVTAFGIDPLRDKRMEGVDTFQQDRVAKVVDEAESYLNEIRDIVEGLKDRALTGRVESFLSSARRMIRTVEEDPRDLTGARRYLGVYLMGARDATDKFAKLYGRTRTPELKTDYEALLTDLEGSFAQRTEKLLLDDRSDMDIEINVLRDRLERDGLKVASERTL